MVAVAVVAAWLAVGALVGVFEARRGYWRRGCVVSAVFGPFAIPLALAAHRRQAEMAAPVVLTRGRARCGRLDVLAGIDWSADSLAAATVAAQLLGTRLRRLTLATVLDYDTAAPHDDSVLHPEPWPEETAARAALEQAGGDVRARAGVEPDSVLLAGDPADALVRYAHEGGYDVIVAACRGRGLSKLLLGSCASRLACRTTVPVLLIPRIAAPAEPGTTAAAASSRHRRGR